jgi:small-conductance mechanosensitive channel
MFVPTSESKDVDLKDLTMTLRQILDQQTQTLAQITALIGRLDSHDRRLARLEKQPSSEDIPALHPVYQDGSRGGGGVWAADAMRGRMGTTATDVTTIDAPTSISPAMMARRIPYHG